MAEATESKVESTSLIQALSVLKEVISLRKTASVFFRQHSSSNELFDQSNEGHLFVIEVLEEVQGLLEPLRPAARERGQDEAATAPLDGKPTNANLYEALDVEDIAEPTLSHDVVLSKKTKQKAKAKASANRNETFELGTSEDLYFILFSFFRDLNEIRRFLHETWEGYRDGQIPLMSASVSTDLAFEVVRQKENSFLVTDIVLSNGEETTLQTAFSKLQKAKSGPA